MSVSVTLTFDYPWTEDIEDENEIRDKLMRFSPDELLLNACKACKPVNVDIEVY